MSLIPDNHGFPHSPPSTLMPPAEQKNNISIFPMHRSLLFAWRGTGSHIRLFCSNDSFDQKHHCYLWYGHYHQQPLCDQSWSQVYCLVWWNSLQFSKQLQMLLNNWALCSWNQKEQGTKCYSKIPVWFQRAVLQRTIHVCFHRYWHVYLPWWGFIIL